MQVNVNKASQVSILALLRPFWNLAEGQEKNRAALRRVYGFDSDTLDSIRTTHICEYCSVRNAAECDHTFPIVWFRYAKRMGVDLRSAKNGKHLCFPCHQAKQEREEIAAKSLRALIKTKAPIESQIAIVLDFLDNEKKIGRAAKRGAKKLDENFGTKIRIATAQAWQEWRKAIAKAGKHEKNWREAPQAIRQAIDSLYENARMFRRVKVPADLLLVTRCIKAKRDFIYEIAKAKLTLSTWREKATPEMVRLETRIAELRKEIFAIV